MTGSSHQPAAERLDHVRLMNEAMALEADGQALLLSGDDADGRGRMASAAARYRESWASAPPSAVGRLVGMLKAAVIAGGGDEEAAHALAELRESAASPTSSYALALAALIAGDDPAAVRAAEGMRGDSEAFSRAADAVTALAVGDRDAYAAALAAILADFEGREEHLTGVAFADTALMFERLAERRAMAVRPRSEMLPPG